MRVSSKLLNFSKITVLATALLALTWLVDKLSISLEPHQEIAKETESKIEDKLDATFERLTQSLTLELFKKESIDKYDLNELKKLEKWLSAENLTVTIREAGRDIYWQNGGSETFCKSYQKAKLQAKICWHPLDAKNRVTIPSLAKQNLPHDFSVVEKPTEYNIFGKYIEIGKCYRSIQLDSILLLLYILCFLILVGHSIRYKAYLALLPLLIFRVFSFSTNWFERFSIASLNENIIESWSYNAIDLSLDTILLFGIIFYITDVLVKKQGFSKTLLAGLSFMHLLLFLSHIRLIQFYLNNGNTILKLDDLSKSSVADLIFFSSCIFVQLAIFHFATTIFKYYRSNNIKRTALYLNYTAAIILTAAIASLIKLDLNLWVITIFLVAYILMLDLFIDVKNRTITWIIWWGIFFSLFLSAVFFNYDIKIDLQQRSQFLKESFHSFPKDLSIDSEIDTTLSTVTRLIENILTLPANANYDRDDLVAFINDSLKREDLLLEIFKESGLSLFNPKLEILDFTSKFISPREGCFFDELNNRIWFTTTLKNSNILLLGIDAIESKQANNYTFNYYRNEQVIHQDYKISSDLLKSIRDSESDIYYEGSEAYVIHKPSTNRLLISQKSFAGLVKPITLFSFLFCNVIIAILLLGLINIVFPFLPVDWPLFIENIESLNSKIQLALILVILLSFVIIATITSSFLKNYLADQRGQFTEDKLESLDNEFRTLTQNADTPKEAIEILKNYNSKIEKIHNVEIEFFKLDSSNHQLNYFTQMFFEKQENPFAYSEKNEASQMGYLPIILRHPLDALAGVAQVEINTKKELSSLNVLDFLGSIFNVYVFLFLIASVLAIFIAQSITRPLALLNQKLTQVKLGTSNELISWEKDDEIGVLIGNYNSMVNKLEQSANALAKRERDSAWREMAKQVAHEIKNPLTPMKLSIQYLEKAIRKNPEDAKLITQKISNTILEQIDNLTGIADAFSNFAELPKTSNVKIELNEIVDVIYNLFRKREDINVNLAVPIDPVNVYGDRSQLVRILNNIVKNATESIPTDRKGEIKLSLKTTNNKAIIGVRDNGIGITEEQKEKIFQPKFTTKDSGSGLGLAIAQNMIESMNGKIYFQTEPDVFTEFFIEFNLIHPGLIEEEGERIALD